MDKSSYHVLRPAPRIIGPPPVGTTTRQTRAHDVVLEVTYFLSTLKSLLNALVFNREINVYYWAFSSIYGAKLR